MVGRPKSNINYALVKDLAGIMCTQEEIAGVLHVSVRTLQRSAEFCRIYKDAQEDAKSSLRRAQWKKAHEGNVGMLIWLGKQYLGQSDKQEQAVSMKEQTPAEIAAKMTDEEIEKRIKEYYGIRYT